MQRSSVSTGDSAPPDRVSKLLGTGVTSAVVSPRRPAIARKGRSLSVMSMPERWRRDISGGKAKD